VGGGGGGEGRKNLKDKRFLKDENEGVLSQ